MAVDQLSLYQDIPDKPYFKIGEVAELAGVPSYVLRFWESEFSNIRPKRTDSGQRLYRRNDVEIILTIKQLLHEKRFTIEAAKQHLRDCPVVNEIEPYTELASHTAEIETRPYNDENPTDTNPVTKELIKEIYLELQRIRDLLF